MCGINGLANNLDKESKLKIVEAMSEASANRGPDGSKTTVNDFVCLNHRLLAITDNPDVSLQPWGEDRQLVFNGEIYNKEELKESLSNTEWKTESDTEVLYHGLCEHGIDFVKKLNGMYAFAWYDHPNIYLVRDYAGIKPLYWSNELGGLAFSSSIKALIAAGVSTTLDKETFNLYWNLGFTPGQQTLFRSINKLCPGEVFTYNVKTKQKTSKIISESIVRHDFNADGFRSAVSDTVESCLMGKRPIGLFLSGGVDSSVILHEVCKHQIKPSTFTTRFECNNSGQNKLTNNDADVAQALSKHYGTDHHELLITPDDFVAAIPNCVDALEEPRYNRSSPAYYLMNQYIAKQGIIVTLSGDGGDEVFTGYPRHKRVRRGDLVEWCYITNLFKDQIKPESIREIVGSMKTWFKQVITDDDPVNRHLYMESLTNLTSDYLIRNDKLGMHFGMEARFPFVNKRFRDYVLGIPSSEKSGKKIMFNSYSDILPEYVINKPKTGWAIPTNEWESKIAKSEYILEVSRQTKDLQKFINTKQLGGKSWWTALYFLCWAHNFKVSL